MQTLQLSTILIVACVLTGAFSACIRKEYHGGPQNTIIKAYETISEQMQVANLNTSVYYLTKYEGSVNVEGSFFTEYLFTIIKDEGEATEETWGLIMQISEYCDETFVDQILWMPIDCAGAPDAAGVILNNNFHNTIDQGSVWGWDHPSGVDPHAYFCDKDNFKACNILKENFSYFYEIAGNIFEPNLNN
jgi:hypothetical protein